MARCTHCRAKVLPHEQACTACGEPIEHDTPPPQQPALGRIIAGRFRLERLIGQGSMGRVYAARRTDDDTRVAVKLLHRRLALDPKVGKRFHREARAASRLTHPNSLEIVDFGEDTQDGTLYIAMELLEGDDLLTVIEQQYPLSPARIGRVLSAVLETLEEAHAAGIIHRDLKPENVVVTEHPDGTDQIKVCDFGIAKVQESEGGSGITVSGFVCGTPEYMAPEQARGEPLDPRADLYSAGAMLYQMLTGEMPFEAETALGVITKHLTEPLVVPSQRRPERRIPRELEAVCLRAMHKDRGRRYADAAAMRQAVQRAVDRLGDEAAEPLAERAPGEKPPPPLGTRPRRRWSVRAQKAIWLALAMLAVGGTATAFALWGPWAQPPSPEGRTARAPGYAADARGGREESSSTEARRVGPADERHGADGPSAPARDAATSKPSASSASSSRTAGARRPAAPDPQPARRKPSRGQGSSDAPDTPQSSSARSRGQPSGPADEGDGVPDRQAAGVPDAGARAANGDAGGAGPARRAFEKGRERFLANEMDAAIEHFERAATLRPDDPKVRKQLGRAYMRAGRVERAVAAYRRYLQLAPDAPDRAIVEQIIRQRDEG